MATRVGAKSPEKMSEKIIGAVRSNPHITIANLSEVTGVSKYAILGKTASLLQRFYL